MTAADATRVDLPALLRHLRGERYPTVVVHAPPLAGKSTFARRLAQLRGVEYLDMLEELSAKAELAQHIDQLDVETIRRMIVGYAAEVAPEVLLVDELDYVIPIWGGDVRPLGEMIRRLSNPGPRVAFVFFLQSRPELETWDLRTAARDSRILSLEQIKPL